MPRWSHARGSARMTSAPNADSTASRGASFVPGPNAARCIQAGSAMLDAVLEAGPLAAGWQDQRWTLARVRDLVTRRFGGAVHRAGDLVSAAPARLVGPDGSAPRA